jgi:hypothetical protein
MSDVDPSPLTLNLASKTYSRDASLLLRLPSQLFREDGVHTTVASLGNAL